MTEPALDASFSDPLVGRIVSGYRVLSLIAKGGMGKVYRAEQASLGRPVALKVLHPTYSGAHDPEFHKRFFLEASICSKLRHPSTITIFDYGRTEDEIYFIAMELLEGRTLHRALRQDGAFAPARVIHVAAQIARSLREAHALGVVHRDLKPANVFLVQHGDEPDFVKVLDFGLVKDLSDQEKGQELTQTGLFLGSPKYMSPEQVRGEQLDTRTDIYSLGVMMYELLAGRPPFVKSSSVDVLYAHVHETPRPISLVAPTQVPSDLEEVVMRALAKRPQDRFASMDELLHALRRAAANLPPDAALDLSWPSVESLDRALHSSRPPSEESIEIEVTRAARPAAMEPKEKEHRRGTIALAVAALALGAAALGIGLAMFQASRVPPEVPIVAPIPTAPSESAPTPRWEPIHVPEPVVVPSVVPSTSETEAAVPTLEPETPAPAKQRRVVRRRVAADVPAEPSRPGYRANPF